jgi:hypothetical protein
LCGTALAPDAARCGTCGLHQQLGAAKPNPFGRKSLWALAGLLLAVYVIALLIVAVAR